MTQTIVNLGTGGAVLNGRNGSTTGADSNDALFLDWTGGNYVYTPIQAASTNRLTVPDAAPLKITGDLDVRVRVALDDWTPSAEGTIASKFNVSSNRSWSFAMQTTGIPRILWSEDGSTLLIAAATATPTITDGSPLWLRFTLDVDNGTSGRDIKFFTSDDGLTWTQLGSTVTQAGVTSIFDSTVTVALMGRDDTGSASAGKIYRAQIFNGINGTKVLDVDTSVITTGAAESFTALTGQTVTITRSTSGRKTVAVVSPVWLFGTDDYMEVADNDLIDFGASDSFTVVAVVRQWATPTNFGRYVSKRNSNTGAGWVLQSNGTNVSPLSVVADAVPNSVNRSGPSFTAGTLAAIGFIVDRNAQTLANFTNGALGTTTSTSTIDSMANALDMRIGANAGATGSYQDFELLGVAVFRQALTAAETAAIITYYQNKAA